MAKTTIVIDDRDVGNSNRGYHNYDATITFAYDDGHRWTEERERAIVDALTAGTWMWHRVTRDGDAWKVNYGYDSGD